MKKVNIGLDIGIASVGWAITDEELNIIDAGVSLFEEAGQTGSGTSGADRRIKRSSRRRLRRRNLRKSDLINLMIKNNLIKSNDDFQANIPQEMIFNLKLKGKKELLTNYEIAAILYHAVKKRGIFSWEDEIIEESASKNLENVDISERKEVTEPSLIMKEFHEANGKLIGVKDDSIRFTNEELLAELKEILNKQKDFGSINEDFINDFIKIFTRKRDYFTGPGLENQKTGTLSPWGWNGDEEFFDRLAGNDTYDKTQPRAPKESLTAYIFNTLNDLNNLKILNREEGITNIEKRDLIIKCIESPKTWNLKLDRIAKFIQVNPEDISGFRIDKNNKAIFTEFKGINKIKDIMRNNNLPIDWIAFKNKDKIDEILTILTKYQDYASRLEQLQKLNYDFLSLRICEVLSYVKNSGTHALSFKTMNEVIAEMWDTNKNSMQILTEQGRQPDYHKNFSKTQTIPVLRKSINEMYISPVVKRSLIQSLKVIKEIQKLKDLEIKNIVIEMAREKNSAEQRQFINKIQKQNEALGTEMKKEIAKVNTSGIDNFKFQEKMSYYLEQDGNCIYSGEKIDITRLMSDYNYCEIDHIIPVSISFDNSRSNKVLVLNSENQSKKNRTPYQYIINDKGQVAWKEYLEGVNRIYKQNDTRFPNRKQLFKKINYLLFEEDINSFKTQQGFIQRNLVDTRYATLEVKKYIENYIKTNDLDIQVKTINGGFTHQLRKNYFRIPNKIREQNKHHAEDAIMISLAAEFKYKNKKLFDLINTKTEEEKLDLDFDQTEFYKKWAQVGDNISKFDNYKFTRKVKQKNNMKISDETIYSAKKIGDNFFKINKIDIYTDDSKKWKTISKLFNEESNQVLMKDSDPKTFNFLQSIWNEYSIDKESGKSRNAFIFAKNELGESITKQSNEDNPPKISFLRYRDKSPIKLDEIFDISHKYKNISADKKRVLLDGKNWLRLDVWYSKTLDVYKILAINSLLISKMQEDQITIDPVAYQKSKEKLKISDTFEKVFELNKYDEVKFKYDGENNNNLYVVGFVQSTNLIEFKKLSQIEEKRMIKSVSKIKDFKKVTSNIIKNKIKILT
ncbi:type II CRISPR RNA-guided endonuclease Cas9 [Spiroplasma alleghenense]|uniref:CRISPR-associated endonuclease Cas9 n=1 Tax=Spiroplasma alleghenense TaxID=216931 RepID=A0A345Z4S8_9MOLU|nr:type II CRISPR RNA-guided endonuclease Cas9 [Spiroplasma alleghenense]AXK51607.1 CRISPR-associated protein Cas9 [Spiroplasma alleghenense]